MSFSSAHCWSRDTRHSVRLISSPILSITIFSFLFFLSLFSFAFFFSCSFIKELCCCFMVVIFYNNNCTRDSNTSSFCFNWNDHRDEMIEKCIWDKENGTLQLQLLCNATVKYIYKRTRLSVSFAQFSVNLFLALFSAFATAFPFRSHSIRSLDCYS